METRHRAAIFSPKIKFGDFVYSANGGNLNIFEEKPVCHKFLFAEPEIDMKKDGQAQEARFTLWRR